MTEDEDEVEVDKVDTDQNTCRVVLICAQKTSTLRRRRDRQIHDERERVRSA